MQNNFAYLKNLFSLICGFRSRDLWIADSCIADCGFHIANCGFRFPDSGGRIPSFRVSEKKSKTRD